MLAGMFNTQQPLTRGQYVCHPEIGSESTLVPFSLRGLDFKAQSGELQKEIREIYATLTSLASLDIPIFNARMMYNCEVPGITKRFK